jgi:hypothetical protein
MLDYGFTTGRIWTLLQLRNAGLGGDERRMAQPRDIERSTERRRPQ